MEKAEEEAKKKKKKEEEEAEEKEKEKDYSCGSLMYEDGVWYQVI